MQIKVNSERFRVGGSILLSVLMATANYACTGPSDYGEAKGSDSKGKENSKGESGQENTKEKTPSKKKSEEEGSKSKEPSDEKSEKTPEESEESESTGSEEEESTSAGEGGDDSSSGEDSTDEPGGDTGDCKVTAQWGSGKPFAAGTAIPNWKIETVFDQNADGEIKGDELTPKKTDMAGVFCANPRNKFAVITFSSPT